MSTRGDLALWLLLAGSLVYAASANNYHLYLLTTGALTVIVGIGLNVLFGLSGQVSFGHVGFYALGAYTAAILTTAAGWSFWLTLPVTAALTGAVGWLLGLTALRASGPYLAMVTIAFGFIVEYGAIEWRTLTGGANGLMNIPHPSVFGYEFGDRAIAYTAVAMTAAALVFYRRLAASAWGLAMRAVRDTEIAAGSLGVNPLTVRTLAFTISAVLAGLAGALFAPLTTFVSPSSFSFFQSILFLLVVIIGGAERTYGPVLGALVVIALPEMLSGLAEYRVLFFGVLLLIVLWIAPAGAAGALAARFPRGSGAMAAPVRAGPVDVGGGRSPIELKVRGLGIRFGGVSAVGDLDFTAKGGQITSIIGPNGAGKTTVLNLVCGFYQPDSGLVTLDGRELARRPAHVIARAGIARTFQTTQLFGQLTVLENLLVALQRGGLGSPWRPLAGDTGATARARALLAFVGYGGDADREAAALPHIDKRLVEVARALALRPRVLMLDEPAAGLGRTDTERLGGLLRKIADAGVAVVLIEHDMSLVMSIADHVVVLDAGRRLAAGSAESVRRDPAVIKAYLGEGACDARPRAAGWRAGRDGQLTARSLGAGYGAAKVLESVDIEVNTGELVAVLGANGAGKSTLMRSLAGLLRPVAGKISFAGADVTLLAAHRLARQGLVLVPEGRQVFPELSVIDNIRLGAYARRDFDPREIDAMLRRFPSLAPRRHSRAGLLSGGEQQMLAIARGLVARPQALLLDEPSLGLAPALINELFGVLTELRDAGITILLVDQMAALALAVSDRGYVIESGHIVHQGSAADIRNDPALERAYLGHV